LKDISVTEVKEMKKYKRIFLEEIWKGIMLIPQPALTICGGLYLVLQLRCILFFLDSEIILNKAKSSKKTNGYLWIEC